MFEFANKFKIENRWIGEGQPVYIIAEAGLSHFGEEQKAYELVDLAVSAGADAVKFQVFDVKEMLVRDQKEWIDRLSPRQLPYEAFVIIQKYCKTKGITFFATAHDEKSLDFLTEINIPVYKIGSGELGNLGYFKKIACLGKPVIFSTGMYKFSDIELALDIFREENNKNVSILHCVTSYPTPAFDVSLLTVQKIKEKLSVISGYSDHTEGMHIPLAAVALGAKVLEKHITLDFNIPNAQDWKVSCGPENLKTFVSHVRDIEGALSLRESGPTKLEKNSKVWATKSLVFKDNMLKGAIVKESDFIAKRPGNGLPPSKIISLVGKKLNNDIGKDLPLTLEDFI